MSKPDHPTKSSPNPKNLRLDDPGTTSKKVIEQLLLLDTKSPTNTNVVLSNLDNDQLVSHLVAEINFLKRCEDDKNREIEELRTKNLSLAKEERKRLEFFVSEHELKVKQLQEKIARTQADNERLSGESVKQGQQIEGLKSAVEDEGKRAVESRHCGEQDVSRLVMQGKGYEEEIGKLRTEIVRLKEELNEKDGLLHVMTVKKQELEKGNGEMERKLAGLAGEAERTKAKLDDAVKMTKEREESCAKHEENLSRVTKASETAIEKAKQEFTAKMAQILDEEKRLRESNQRLEEESRLKGVETERLKGEVERLKVSLKGIQDKAQEQAEMIAGMQGKANESETQKDQAMVAKAEKFRKLQEENAKTITALELATKEKTLELDNARRDLDRVLLSIQDLESKNRSLQDTLQTLQLEKKDQTLRLKDYETAVHSLKSKIQDSESLKNSKIQELTSKIQDLEQQLDLPASQTRLPTSQTPKKADKDEILSVLGIKKSSKLIKIDPRSMVDGRPANDPKSSQARLEAKRVDSSQKLESMSLQKSGLFPDIRRDQSQDMRSTRDNMTTRESGSNRTTPKAFNNSVVESRLSTLEKSSVIDPKANVLESRSNLIESKANFSEYNNPDSKSTLDPKSSFEPTTSKNESNKSSTLEPRKPTSDPPKRTPNDPSKKTIDTSNSKEQPTPKATPKTEESKSAKPEFLLYNYPLKPRDPLFDFTPDFLSLRQQTLDNPVIRQKVKDIQEKDSKTPESLAAQLKKLALSSQIEKAWAIFFWISQNIAYNLQGYVNKQCGDSSPETTLKTRLAVCAGYSSLYNYLGQALGLETKVISGYAKGFSYKAGQKFKESDHDWNVVKIDKNWYLLDATWGTGHVMSSSSKFEFSLKPYYFLCMPQHFLANHFPLEKEWQLLKNPITLEEYEKAIKLGDVYFELGLELINPAQPILEVEDAVTVTLKAPEDVAIIASVLNLTAGVKVEDATFVQSMNSTYLVDAIMPSKGQYKLSVYAKRKNDTRNYVHAVDYLVNAKGNSRRSVGFPQAYGFFFERGCYLYAPKQKFLKIGGKAVFKLRVPGGEEVAVIVDKAWSMLRKVGDDVFEGEVEVKAKVVGVFARFEGKQNFDGLLTYEGV